MTSPFTAYATIPDFAMFEEEDLEEKENKKRIKYAMFAIYRLPTILDNKGSIQPLSMKIRKRYNSSQLNKFAGILMNTTRTNRKVRFSPCIREYHYKNDEE